MNLEKIKTMESYLGQGVLFYAGLYINIILVIIAFLTGRLVFLFFIVLTAGLILYMNYLVVENNAHLISAGEFIEGVVKKFFIHQNSVQ